MFLSYPELEIRLFTLTIVWLSVNIFEVWQIFPADVYKEDKKAGAPRTPRRQDAKKTKTTKKTKRREKKSVEQSVPNDLAIVR